MYGAAISPDHISLFHSTAGFPTTVIMVQDAAHVLHRYMEAGGAPLMRQWYDGDSCVECTFFVPSISSKQTCLVLHH